MSDDDRSTLVLPLPVVLGLAGVVVAAGWLWTRAVVPQAAATPVAAVAGTIPVGDVVRVGTPAARAVAAEAEPGCAVLVRAPELRALSDKSLMDAGAGLDASPVLLARDGAALTAHSRGTACDDGFAHTPKGLAARPASGGAAGTWTLSWRPDVRATVRTGPGASREVLYALPGTTLSVDVPAWDPAWGAPEVHLAAIAAATTAAATLGLGDDSTTVPGAGGPVRAALSASAAAAPTTLSLTVPADGPALVVTDWAIGSGSAATAIVGTVAGARAPLATPTAAPVDPTLPVVTRDGLMPHRTLQPTAPKPGACGWVAPLPDLTGLSDLSLSQRYGLRDASPLVVLRDGEALTAHQRADACTNTFAHPPQGVLVRPAPGGPAISAWTLAFLSEPTALVGTPGGGTATIAWVYAGMTSTWTWATPPATVAVEWTTFGGEQPAVLVAGGAEWKLAPETEGREVVSLRGGGALVVGSPADGPIVLVRGVAAE